MFFVLKRKNILYLVTLLVLFVVLSVVVSQNQVATVYFGKSIRKTPIYRVQTEEKKVALTFDAAWGGDKTQGILDILKENDVSATFFLVGFWVDKYPELVRKIYDQKLDIGNHSKNHLNMPKLSVSQMDEEFSYVNDGVKKITGESPKFFRAPFGDYSNSVIDEASAHGLTSIQWDVDSLDWKGISSREITNRVLKKVQNGSIILFHNNSDHVLDALPIVILELKNRGYKMVKLSDLILTGDYVIDNNGVQIQETKGN